MIPSEFMLYLEQRVKFLKDEEERHQWRFAQLQSTVFNSHPVKRRKYLKAKDFMPTKKQTTEDMLKQVEMLNRMFGGEDKRTQNGSS